MNSLPGYDTWKLMSPEEDELPEVPYTEMMDKIKEWAEDPPEWLCEKAIEACDEDRVKYGRKRR